MESVDKFEWTSPISDAMQTLAATLKLLHAGVQTDRHGEPNKRIIIRIPSSHCFDNFLSWGDVPIFSGISRSRGYNVLKCRHQPCRSVSPYFSTRERINQFLLHFISENFSKTCVTFQFSFTWDIFKDHFTYEHKTFIMKIKKSTKTVLNWCFSNVFFVTVGICQSFE